MNAFEYQSGFQDVLAVYDAQIGKLEAHNLILEKELKKLSASVVTQQVQSIKSQEQPGPKDPLKHFKTLQQTHKNLFKDLESQQEELTELRKQKRVFGLHKRCAVEQTLRLNHAGKRTDVQDAEIGNLRTKANQLEHELKNMQA